MSSYRRVDKLHCINMPEHAAELDIPPKMLLPRIVASTTSPHHPYTQLQDVHLDFCLKLQPWKFPPSRASSPLSSSSSSSSSPSTRSSSPSVDAADRYSPHDLLASSALADLNTISAAFPSLRSRAIILSMAAWFRLLRLVDATLETLPCACALDRIINANLIDALRRGCRIGVVKAARPNPLENFTAAKARRHRFAAGQQDGSDEGFRENAWGCREGGGGSSSGSSSNRGRRMRSNSTSSSSDSDDAAAAAARTRTATSSPQQGHYCCDPHAMEVTARCLRHLTSVFRAHVQALLPERVYRRLAAAICNTWAGYVAEASFRESVTGCCRSSEASSTTSRSLLGTYLAVRERTIGVAPFFVLLEADVLPPGHANSAALTALKQNVTDVVVLQNDLCGLEADVREDNILNFVILASDELRVVMEGKEVRTTAGSGRLRGEEFGMTVQEAVKKGNEGILRATALHNNAVDMASRYCEYLVGEMEREHCDEEAVVANEILNFVTTHYRWASQAWDI